MDSSGTHLEATRSLRVLELYCGIGGCSAALSDRAEIVAAVDINTTALGVYRHNFPHTSLPINLEFISSEDLQRWNADLWWLSPPCQPFTVRGLRRDTEDPRTRSFLRMIDCLEVLRPTFLALENVPGFRGSRTHTRLRSVLDELSYSVHEVVLCPTELGVPNRRQRLFLVAGLTELQPMNHAGSEQEPLASFLDSEPSRDLWVDQGLVDKYGEALSVVDTQKPTAVASCFTSAYGRSPVRSGSYLETATGLRRFSPTEILRLLGFPSDFVLPDDLSTQIAWRLVGNSLSVPSVRHVLSAIPALADSGAPYSR